MSIYKNVASQKIAVFAWDTINDTGKTGDAANITAQISKDGAATAATNDANPTELDATDAPGVYLFDMTQTETNADLLILNAVSSTSDIIIEPIMLYTIPGDGTALAADMIEVSGDATAADNAESFFDGTGYAGTNNVIPTVTTVGTVTTNTDLVTAAAVRAEMDSNSTQLAAIVADTNELQTDDIPGAIAALNDPTAAAIADAVWEEAIADHSGTGGSTAEALSNASSAGDPWSTSVPGAYGAGTAGNILGNLNDPTAAAIADQVWEEAIADHSGTGGSTAEALNAAGGAGDPWVTALPGSYTSGQAGNIIGNLNDPTAASIADAVLDEALSGHTTAGTLGKAVADIETDATAILADTNELQTDDIPGAIAALNDPTAAAVADAVWEEAIADHSGTGGSTAEALASISAAGIADAVWDEAASGHVSAGTFGALLGSVADTIWDEVVDAGYPANAQTARELMRIFASALSGLTNNGTGSQFIARDLADSKDVITASIDANGFRTSMTLDGS